MITTHYSAIDGFRARRTFKTLKGAQKYAQERVGKHPDIATGWGYAVSDDGIGKITVEGALVEGGRRITLADLFPEDGPTGDNGFKAAQEAKGLVWIGDDHSEIWGVWVPKRLCQWDDYEACWAMNPRKAMVERDQHGMPVNYYDFADDAQREEAERVTAAMIEAHMDMGEDLF